jgi:cytoplasmic iron level regulating protein YaaA (DUF328/UPF0246 family)
MTSQSLTIISCGKAKIWDRDFSSDTVPARDAYTGSLFRQCRRYAEAVPGERWLIFSAKYGLLLPRQLIQNYNVTITDPNSITVEELRSQWEQQFRRVNQVTSLCSRKYDQRLRAALPPRVTVRNPLEGCNLYKRCEWLRRELSKLEAARMET